MAKRARVETSLTLEDLYVFWSFLFVGYLIAVGVILLRGRVVE